MAFYNADDLSESLKRIWRIERGIKYAWVGIIRAIPELSRYERDPEWIIAAASPKQRINVCKFRRRLLQDGLMQMCHGATSRDAWVRDVQEAISGVSKRWYYVKNADRFTCAICHDRHITHEAAEELRDTGEKILRSMQKTKTKTLHPLLQSAGAAGAGLSG